MLRGLLDTETNRISDICEAGSEFEVHPKFQWVDIPEEFRDEKADLVMDNGVVKASHKFVEGGSPKVSKKIRLSEITVSFNGKDYQGSTDSQDALARNIATGADFNWIAKDNTFDVLTVEQGKELLKLMTDATFTILEQYRSEMDALLAAGFTEEELTTM
jgi:hypothetical protein